MVFPATIISVIDTFRTLCRRLTVILEESKVGRVACLLGTVGQGIAIGVPLGRDGAEVAGTRCPQHGMQAIETQEKAEELTFLECLLQYLTTAHCQHGRPRSYGCS